MAVNVAARMNRRRDLDQMLQRWIKLLLLPRISSRLIFRYIKVFCFFYNIFDLMNFLEPTLSLDKIREELVRLEDSIIFALIERAQVRMDSLYWIRSQILSFLNVPNCLPVLYVNPQYESYSLRTMPKSTNLLLNPDSGSKISRALFSSFSLLKSSKAS